MIDAFNVSIYIYIYMIDAFNVSICYVHTNQNTINRIKRRLVCKRYKICTETH